MEREGGRDRERTGGTRTVARKAAGSTTVRSELTARVTECRMRAEGRGGACTHAGRVSGGRGGATAAACHTHPPPPPPP